MALPKRQEKDAEHRKLFGKVFDSLAVKDLFKLKAKGVFDTYHGVWKEGKESRILLVSKEEVYRIIKIYKVEAGNFKNMIMYLEGDKRFSNVRHNRRSIFYAWCKKEFHNLKIAKSIGLRSPEPIEYIHNIIAMELLGDKEPYPQLKETYLSNPVGVFDDIVEQIKKLLHKGGLVHGDVSEYNILIGHSEEPYMIDFAQAVLVSHPYAEDMLKRDVKNLINYFNKRYDIGKKFEDVYSYISEGVF